MSDVNKCTINCLREMAEACNIDKIGVTKWTSEQFPGAKSVIVGAMSYFNPEDQFLTPVKYPYGEIARYTWRNNYKALLKNLSFLSKKLSEHYKINTFKVYSNGPLSEKFLANRAGIGWFGKNSIIQVEEFGSNIVLGEIIVDYEFSSHFEPPASRCGECDLCMQACPTGAIVAPFVVDKEKCLQHLSNSLQPFEPWVSSVWGRRLYGCSICQDVCPNNINPKPGRYVSKYGVIGSSLNLLDVLQCSEVEFREMVKGNQLGARWINFDAIKRNAIQALASYHVCR